MPRVVRTTCETCGVWWGDLSEYHTKWELVICAHTNLGEPIFYFCSLACLAAWVAQEQKRIAETPATIVITEEDFLSALGE